MSRLLRLIVCGLISACLARVPAAWAVNADERLAPIQPGLDYHSFANVEQFRVTHVDLNLRVDFAHTVLFGAVGLEVKRIDPRATDLVLDTRDLDIRGVSEMATDVLGATAKSQTTWVSRPYHLEKADPILGSPLVIEMPPSKKTRHVIRIEYMTSPTASALQWLTEKQDPHRNHPLMYTLSEPIGTRSWIPLQDTPSARVTYNARIFTPDDVLAVMSAKNDPKAKRNGDYSFAMPDAIPPYLIALAVGDLRFKETGPRTGVYAEYSLMAAATKEFVDAESMIKAAESIAGPYPWDRYDMVVLPPSFPVGGMGNPRLSFISPTIIAGDKSLLGVVAHEVAHSWAGDLVTGATWRDAWLSEGFAGYLQSRIMSQLYGDRIEIMDRVLDLQSLRDGLATRKPDEQVLAIDLRDRDPAGAFNEVLYEKGRLFFLFLDAKFGRERFDAFMRDYFDHFAGKSITTEQFLGYLKTNLLDRYPNIVTADEVMQWVHAPGIPADAVLPATNAFEAVDEARDRWLDGRLPAKKLDTRDWLTPQWRYFLDHMPATLRKEQLADLDQTFALTRSSNAVVTRSWLMLVIRNGYRPATARLEEYLMVIGRRKLIVPLYEELMKTPAGATLAKRVFALARPGYHPQTAAALDPIVNPAHEGQDDE
ncbi:MAG: M1 family metallopeptidase [Steroidobacteraceae bacterium]